MAVDESRGGCSDCVALFGPPCVIYFGTMGKKKLHNVWVPILSRSVEGGLAIIISSIGISLSSE